MNDLLPKLVAFVFCLIVCFVGLYFQRQEQRQEQRRQEQKRQEQQRQRRQQKTEAESVFAGYGDLYPGRLTIGALKKRATMTIRSVTTLQHPTWTQEEQPTSPLGPIGLGDRSRKQQDEIEEKTN